MNLKTLLSVVVIATIAVAGGFYLGRTTGPAGDAESMDMGDSGRKVLYWQSPMNPTEVYDAPGKSSMGMDLIPVYDDDKSASSGGSVRIDPSTMQNMGVRTDVIRREDFSRVIRTVGEVDFDEERLYLVNSKISGWIDKLFVHFVGEEVSEGDPLMEIYSPELVSTQEEFILALKNFQSVSDEASNSAHRDAKELLASTRKRLEYWDIPESEIARLEETGQVRKTISINSPATGIVVKRMAIDGAHIKAGEDLFQIADLSTVWVHASFYDNEVPWISIGQKVEMELSYLPGKKYVGRVSYIYPFLRTKARDVHVRLIFDNPNLDLKPGMYANVDLTGKTIRNALVMPSEAIIRSGQRSIVFVVRGGGEFEPREIKIGEEGGKGNAYVHVLSGLTGDEEVVVSAQFMLDSESRLQEAIQKMLASRSKTNERPEGAVDTSMEGMDMSTPSADSSAAPVEAEMKSID